MSLLFSIDSEELGLTHILTNIYDKKEGKPNNKLSQLLLK